MRSNASRRVGNRRGVWGPPFETALQASSATVLSERLPWPVVADESIENGEEFAHGGKRHLGMLTDVAQAALAAPALGHPGLEARRRCQIRLMQGHAGSDQRHGHALRVLTKTGSHHGFRRWQEPIHLLQKRQQCRRTFS